MNYGQYILKEECVIRYLCRKTGSYDVRIKKKYLGSCYKQSKRAILPISRTTTISSVFSLKTASLVSSEKISKKLITNNVTNHLSLESIPG
jgi:hypothetical protein